MRLGLVLGTELSAKNKIQAVGLLAVPVLRYSFGIVNWHQEELQEQLVFHCYTYTYLTQQTLYYSLLRMTTMANWLKEQFCNLVYLAEFSVQ
jgi:hypothetical protein